MKHILIILSILLLSSPLFGKETGVLFQYETSSGIVWKSFGSGKVQPKYEGEITYGEPNGQGTYTYLDGRKYIVEWKNGYEHGQGTFTFSNEVKWIGQFSSPKHLDLKFIRYNPWNITEYDKNGKINERFVNGECIKN